MSLRERVEESLQNQGKWEKGMWPRPYIEDVADIVYPLLADLVHQEWVVFASEINKSLKHVFGDSQLAQSLVKLTNRMGRDHNVNVTNLADALRMTFGEYDKIDYSQNSVNAKGSSIILYYSPERLQEYIKQHVTQKTQIVLTCNF